MKIITRVEFEWNGSEYVPTTIESFDYDGPVALCTGAETAGAAAATSGGAKGAGTAASALGAAEFGGMTAAPAFASALPAELALSGVGGGMSLAPGAIMGGMEMLPAASFMAPAAASTFLGLSPTQWLTNGGIQLGSMLLQGAGANQRQGGYEDAYNKYNSFVTDVYGDMNKEFDNALSPYSNPSFSDAHSAQTNKLMDQWNLTRPDYSSAPLPESTPDVVKSDIVGKTTEQKAKDDSQYMALAQLNGLGNLLGMNNLSNSQAIARMKLLQQPLKTAGEELKRDMALAGEKGSVETGLGNLTSSLGNLMLASDLVKGNL